MDNSTWKSQLLSLGKKIFERGFIVATILRPGGYL